MSTNLSRRDFMRLVAMTGAGAVLASCAPAPTPVPTAVPTVDKAKMTGTFTVASHSEIEARKKATDAFFKKYYPNMTVKYDVTPGLDNYFIKLQAQIAGGTPPDYMLMHETRALAYAAQGLVLPLDNYQKANPMLGKPEEHAGLEAAKYKGTTYVWPSTFANYAILYNKDLFDKAGVPYPKDEWTWQDLVDTAKKFKLPDTWGLTGMIDDLGWVAGWYPLLKAYGGETFDEMDTQCLLNSPEGIQAFDVIRDLWCSKVHPTPAAAKQLGGGYAMFLEGRVAMCYFFVGVIADAYAKRKGNFKLGLVALPKGPKGRFIRIGGSSYAIPKGSKYPDIAWELMRYQLSDPEGVQFGYDDGGGTAKVDFFLKYYAPKDDVATMVPEWKTVAVDQPLKHGVFVRYSKIGTQFSPMIGAESAALADCGKSSAEVVKTITDKANQMIKDFKA